MGLSPHLVHWLVALGHDAEHLLDRGQEKSSDQAILGYAHEEERTILTADNDFAQLAAQLQISGPSIIVFRLSSYKLANVQNQLKNILDTFSRQLALGCIISVNDRQARVRALPIRRDQ